jgi:hypothetical protein
MKIWFNRWFSTSYHLIEKIKNNPDNRGFTIYGSHPNTDSVYLQACDYVEQEPDIEGQEYLLWCLDFVQKHNIDIFVPRKENVLISKNLTLFHDLGVKVLVCPEPEVMEMMDNKKLMYEDVQNKDIVPLPHYRTVTNVTDFEKAYNELKQYGKVCFKPIVGEGAAGFRIIDETADTIESIFEGVSHKISLSRAIQLLSKEETFPELMLLEFLDGFEYSIDCIAYNGELLSAVPRKKAGGRIRYLENNPELLEIAEKFTKEYKVPYIFNIQVKYKDGIPKLLEVNPRMSGGLHLTCMSGINYPYEAIKLLIEEKGNPLNPQFDIKLSQLEREFMWR